MRAKHYLAVIVLCAVPMFGQVATAEHQATFVQVDHGVYTFEYRNTVITAKCINTTHGYGITLRGCALFHFMPGDSIPNEYVGDWKDSFVASTDTITVTEAGPYGAYQQVEFKVLSMKPKGKNGAPVGLVWQDVELCTDTKTNNWCAHAGKTVCMPGKDWHLLPQWKTFHQQCADLASSGLSGH